MELETFFEQFELLADAPNGVQKLRQLILQLAVQGKLVPQDPNDEPAEVLLERIEAEKKRLVQEGKIKKEKKLPPVDVDKMPFELPNGWEWCDISKITSKVTDGEHITPKRTADGYYLLSARNIQDEGIVLDRVDYVPQNEFERIRKRCNPDKDDILLSCSGSVGRIAIVDKDNTYVMVRSVALLKPFHDYLYTKYIAYILKSPFVQEQIIDKSKASAQANLFLGKIKEIKIALPPLPEQYRIVAKVDRLMALCDELEARQEKRRKRILQLGEVATSQLLTPSTPEAFNQHWQGICDNFDLLYSTPENVSQLRQAILQLAVMGKLVPQDPNDEPASVLLERIREEKALLVKEGKIRKSEKLPPVDVDEMPFELPQEWMWAYVQDVGEVKLGRQRSPKNHFGSHMVPYLRVANVLENKLDLSDVKEMNFSPEEQAVFRLRYGDILLNEGQSYELLGRPALYRDEIPGACFQNTLVRFRHFSKVLPEYALIVFLAYMYNGRFRKEAQQTTNIAHLSASRLSEIEFPLPPFAEQKRIVAKVDRLMSLCDELEAKLTQSISDRKKLMETAVRQVLAV